MRAFIAMGVVLAAGCRDQSYRKVVADCSELPAAPTVPPSTETVMDRLTPGTARLHLGWTADGETHEVQVEEAEAFMIFVEPGRWHVQAEFPCSHGASTSFQFSDATNAFPVEAGAYPLVSFGFGVPELEQGVRDGVASGQIRLTEADGSRASGVISGRGEGPLVSYFADVDVGQVTVEVTEFIFRDVE